MANNNFLVPAIKSESLMPKKLPSPFSAAGMLQPSHLQAPPMFGPRGTTIPPKHLATYAHFKVNRSQPRFPVNNKKYNHQNRSHDSCSRYNNKSHNNNRPPQQYPNKREFWCEPCDRDFKSQDLFAEHKSQHQKCNIDGCKFEGHEIIVTKHIQMQHSTGLYDRLKNLETPEDISKWREERKKRYPTKANIELRQQMQEERNKRGERLTNSTARFGRSSDRRSGNNKSTEQNHPPDTKKGGKKKRRRPNKKNILKVERRENENGDNESVDKDSVSCNGMPRFCGTSQMKNYKYRKEVEPKNALSSLLGMYESDSNASEQGSDEEESSEETESETTILKSTEPSDNESAQEANITEEEPTSHIAERNSVSESSIEEEPNDPEDLPFEEPILKQEDASDFITATEVTEVAKSSKRKLKEMDKRISKRPTIMDLSKKYRNQNTMLEKLLQNNIRHERNVLLQCVRHVVKENFFGIGQKPSLK